MSPTYVLYRIGEVLGQYPTLLECTEVADWFFNEFGIVANCYINFGV